MLFALKESSNVTRAFTSALNGLESSAQTVQRSSGLLQPTGSCFKHSTFECFHWKKVCKFVKFPLMNDFDVEG